MNSTIVKPSPCMFPKNTQLKHKINHKPKISKTIKCSGFDTDWTTIIVKGTLYAGIFYSGMNYFYYRGLRKKLEKKEEDKK